MSAVAELTGKGRRWLQGGHPWVFADDVRAVEGAAGEVVALRDPGGAHLGWATFSDRSRIALRLLTRRADPPDRAFWQARLARALERRRAAGLLAADGACRLVGGDADGVPGLVVDRYASVLVLQSGTQGSDRLLELVCELLPGLLDHEVTAVVERSDASVRRLEGLEPRTEVRSGALAGPVLVREDALVYEVDVLAGHKTGHYLDQRDNRRRAAAHAAGERVLDAFSYDGLFGIRAALAGAEEVVCIDQARTAGERLARNAELNGVADRVSFRRANAMHELRALAEGPERWGLVVVDPPAFARNRREVEGAARGYVELNRRAFALARDGGRVVSASCSHGVKPEAFVGHLRRAAADAGRDVWLEDFTGQPPDHPVLLGLPESAYLKCAFLRVEDA